MGINITVNYEGKPCYPIMIEDSFKLLPDAVKELGFNGTQKACIISDSNVAPLYLNEVTNSLKNCFRTVVSAVFPAGEQYKNVDTISSFYQKLIEEHFDRKDLLVALGGGVTGDMCGFTAATYLRGISFIQIPTTVLAQVDSSVGGKTGVDFRQFKNMVGAFYQPRLVYMNLCVLNDLSDEHFYAGMAEVIKYGLIKDASFFKWLIDNREKILCREPETLRYMIARCCEIKRDVVERDPKEQGERALLNLGHTIGHAIEKLSDFKLIHGCCVAVGTAAAAEISFRRGYITAEEKALIKQTLQSYNLPVSAKIASAQEVLDTTKSDKKMEAGKIKFILLEQIGNACIDRSVTDEEILEAIESISE